MKSLLFIVPVAILSTIMVSCGGKEIKEPRSETKMGENRTISLNIESAIVLDNLEYPGNNTAEWQFNVDKPGRYEVWLSSLTLDTMDMKFNDIVTISLNDERIEARPVGNRVESKPTGMTHYHLADSYIGTFYIDTPGQQTLQVISDRIHDPMTAKEAERTGNHTVIKSVKLTLMKP